MAKKKKLSHGKDIDLRGTSTSGSKLAEKASGHDVSMNKEVKLHRNRSPNEQSKIKVEKESDFYKEKFQEKHYELSEMRGASKDTEKALEKRPQMKKRLQFQAKEDIAKENSKLQTAEKKAQKAELKAEKAERKLPQKRKVVMEKYYEEAGVKPKTRLKFESEPDIKSGKPTIAQKALTATSAAMHTAIAQHEEDNAAVEATHKLELGAESGVQLKEYSKRHKQKKASKLRKKANQKQVDYLYKQELAQNDRLKKSNALNKQMQKKKIQRAYADAKRKEQAGSAVSGTIESIKKIGGKIADFFKADKKVFVGAMLIIMMILLLVSSLSSCSAVIMQNLVTYTSTSYLSSDDAIYQAELYYTQLETNLQEEINRMQSSQSGYDEYRYNISPIEHDPFVLISYLSAKYEEFTFDQVKGELDTLFALQYNLETEGTTETITDTRMVRVGESLGQVVTSGYCNCRICCGQWSGGPTASGAMPTSNHTIAVDAANPFVPMGTHVIMNGVEYVVEDTGNFARYGVQFDVYYDSHATASAHGHKTWEAFLADDNGQREVEVTSTRTVDVMNVTLTNGGLLSICNDRLNPFKRELFSAYNDTKGNLQMFESPFDFNWYSRVSSYYGYRIHPISGENQIHNGLDIAVPEGTPVKAGLDGTVTTSTYNDSYGNYVIIKDQYGYELRYAHLASRSVSEGQTIARGDEIGTAGNTGNSTGSHLHLELLKNGERMNPIFYTEVGSGSGGFAGGNEYCSDAARALLEEAGRYVGTPYVWGGYSPSGFDCSGFVSYALTHSGARNTGRMTAQGLYNICTPVSESDIQPGDLIFFTRTYQTSDPVTHVGIYVGGGQMIHCGHPVQYTSIYSSYWQSHFYGFGRW